MQIDAGAILQGGMLALIVAAATLLWKTSTNLARLEERFTAHERLDDERHESLDARIP